MSLYKQRKNYMNRISTLFILCFLFTSQIFPQKVIQFEEPLKTGQIYLTDSIAIPYVNAGYTVLLPEEKPRGLVVFFNGNSNPLDYNSEPYFEYYALKSNIATMYVTTENRLEFFFDFKQMEKVENYLNQAIENYNLPKEKMLFAGMSLAGTRVMKFTDYILKKNSKSELKPDAIAICDSPLDFVRFWKEEVEARDLNFNSSSANEGAWVSGYLEKNLGGTPDEKLNEYADYSPYCYESDDKDWSLYRDINIRAYSEPDVKWWMEYRRKDYYGMNVIDLAAFVNELHKNGYDKAELILTENKGYLPDGSRHPHSWSIVDNEELINWFLSLP